MSCTIVIPVWNRPDETKRCIESVLEKTTRKYRLTIIDNASDSPTRRMLESFRKQHPEIITLIQNEENSGFIRASNQGLRKAETPYVCLLNNDTVVTDSWLTEMIRIASSYPAIGLVNPSSNNFGKKPGRKSPDEMAFLCRENEEEILEQAAGTGFCLLIKKEVLDKVGLLDEVYGVGFFEDSDFSFRARRAGYRCVRGLRAYVHHDQHATFNERSDMGEVFACNKALFESRWGVQELVIGVLGTGSIQSVVRKRLDRGDGVELCGRKKDILNFKHEWKMAGYQDHANLKYTLVRFPLLDTALAIKLVTKKKKVHSVIICGNKKMRFVNIIARNKDIPIDNNIATQN